MKRGGKHKKKHIHKTKGGKKKQRKQIPRISQNRPRRQLSVNKKYDEDPETVKGPSCQTIRTPCLPPSLSPLPLLFSLFSLPSPILPYWIGLLTWDGLCASPGYRVVLRKTRIHHSRARSPPPCLFVSYPPHPETPHQQDTSPLASLILRDFFFDMRCTPPRAVPQAVP